MKINLGKTDRIIRLLLGALLIALYVSGTVTGTWGIILLVIASVSLLTGLFRFCPLYSLFGIQTCNGKG